MRLRRPIGELRLGIPEQRWEGVDVVVTVLNGPPEIFMNGTASGHHWIILKLVGVKDNRDGLGTRIKDHDGTWKPVQRGDDDARLQLKQR